MARRQSDRHVSPARQLAQHIEWPSRSIPRSLIVADEGSMISIIHLAAITEYAARNRCKLVLAGDHEQLAAPKAAAT